MSTAARQLEQQSEQVAVAQRGPAAAVDAERQPALREPLLGRAPHAAPADHAELLRNAARRTTGLSHTMRNLQRAYGNQYTRQIVAMARTPGGLAQTEAAPEVEAAIQRERGGGQGLQGDVRARMESSFSADFSRVRIHTGAQADTLNRALSARAFTTGQDIFFRAGEYNPATSGGQELIAHELTHAVQQTGTVKAKLVVGAPDDVYEQEAEQIARQVAHNTRRDQSSDPAISHAGSLARGAAQGIAKASTVQRWESPEHIKLGDEAGGASTGLIVLECYDRDFPERKGPVDSWPSFWKKIDTSI